MSAPLASVLVPGGDATSLRRTLDALWSELACLPLEVLVATDEPAAQAVVTRENAQRARLVETPTGERAGARVARLVEAARSRAAILLAPGAVTTPGWARELLLVAQAGEPFAVTAPRVAGSGVPASQGLSSRVDPATVDALASGVPGRGALRAVAELVRFDETRWDDLPPGAPLDPGCVLLPRAALERLGPQDGWETLAALALDVARAGVALRVARRALVWRPAPRPAAARDEAELAARERLRGAARAARLSVAIELEPGDVAHAALVELARALLVRGAAVVTFSRAARPAARPTPAAHVAGRAPPPADVVLLRGVEHPPGLRLRLPGEVADGEDDLELPAGGVDAWVHAIEARASEVRASEARASEADARGRP